MTVIETAMDAHDEVEQIAIVEPAGPATINLTTDKPSG